MEVMERPELEVMRVEGEEEEEGSSSSLASFRVALV